MIGLFDVDGTILDSMSIYENLGYHYLKSKGIEVSSNINDILYPMTFYQSAMYLKIHYHLDDSIDEIILSLQSMIYLFYKDEVQLKDGIIDVLELLKKKDYSLYIITSSSKELIDASFQRLKIDDYFKDIFTCDDLRLNKDKQFYLEVLRRIHDKASNCIVFEDNANSAMYAKQCGMKVIGIKDNYARDNIQNIADIYIKKWRDLNEDSFNDSR